MSDNAAIDINDDKYNRNTNTDNDSDNDSRSNRLLQWLLLENDKRTFYTIMNIDISATTIFTIVVLLQLLIFIIITMHIMVNNIKDGLLVFDGTELEAAIKSNTFLLLSVVILSVSSTVLINSILEIIDNAITIRLIISMMYKIFLYLTILSPFIGVYTVNFFRYDSYLVSVEGFYYMYFFLTQQNILASLLAIEIGQMYNNKLLNYYSINAMLLMFNIGTGSVVAYTHNKSDDDDDGGLVDVSYVFSYIPVIMYVLIFTIISIYLTKQGSLSYNDFKYIALSITAISYEICITILIENIGINPLDQSISHCIGFTSMIILLSFIGVVVPMRLLNVNLNKCISSLNEAQIEKGAYFGLLKKILPEKIVNDLKNNVQVEPQYFDSSTIFFSDIESFTTICSSIKPIGVVNLLNRLYTAMDAVGSFFPTYKIETVGDAYVCVSGLPEKNTNHAVNIANFALVVRDMTKLVPSPIDKNTPIRIRIGLHTGPVMAGVVGTDMPRYCIFGDTVNIASRMESTGAVDKIQISEATFNILSATNEFIIEERGIVDVKGKGSLKTWWLVDYSSNNKILTTQFVQLIKSKVSQLISETNEHIYQLDEIKRSLSLEESLFKSPSQVSLLRSPSQLFHRSSSQATIYRAPSKASLAPSNMTTRKSFMISQHYSLNNHDDNNEWQF